MIYIILLCIIISWHDKLAIKGEPIVLSTPILTRYAIVAGNWLQRDKSSWAIVDLKKTSLKNLQVVMSWGSLPANGKNPNNFIKVKINHKIYNVNPGQEYVEDKCWILQPDPVLKVP